MGCQDSVLNIMVCRDSLMGLEVKYTRYRAWSQAPDNVTHLLLEWFMRSLAFSAYIHRQDVVLHVLDHHLRHYYVPGDTDYSQDLAAKEDDISSILW